MILLFKIKQEGVYSPSIEVLDFESTETCDKEIQKYQQKKDHLEQEEDLFGINPYIKGSEIVFIHYEGNDCVYYLEKLTR